jgi:cysteine desulfurase
MNEKVKYWDYAASTPMDIRVFEAMTPYFIESFANPNSNHVFGKTANEAVDISRKNVARLINANVNQIIYTSGSTESINLVLKGYVEANKEKGNHIITTKIEHKAVINTCEFLESKGYEVTYLDVNSNGLIDINQLEDSISDKTVLICIMLVNNETGVIEDLKNITKIAHRYGVPVFSDSTQAVGKIFVDVNDIDIDFMCFSGHKINGPKGIGVLFKKEFLNIEPLFHGGNQERNIRPGTLNVPGIVGIGKACEIIYHEFDKIKSLKEQTKKEIIELFNSNKWGVENFQNVSKVPNIISIKLINDIDAEDFLIINRNNFAASTGSACNSNIIEPSHVIKALFIEDEQDKIIRISI